MQDQDRTAQTPWRLRVKRLIDIVGSVLAFILLSPILALIAILVFVFDGSPVLYCWQVVEWMVVYRLVGEGVGTGELDPSA